MNEFYLSVEQMGDHIYERFIDSEGREQVRKTKYAPTMFQHAMAGVDSPYRDIYGKTCIKKNFESIKEAKNWMQRMKDVGMEALGMDDFRLAYISDAYRKEIEYDRDKIRIASLDIEVTAPEFPDPREAKYAIDAITHYDSVEDKFFVYDLVEGGLDEWVASKVDTENEISEEDLKKIVYRSFQTEKSLLSAYIKDWKERTPVIVTGWNSNKFDIAYIITRYLNIFGQNVVRHFSPFGKVTAKTTTDHYGNEQLGYEIYGVAQMDGMDLYKKFSFTPQPSYSLGAIAEFETGKSKVDYEGSLSELRQADHQKYITYNIVDVIRVLDIDGKRNFIELVLSVAYYAKINFPGVMSPLKTWDAIIYNSLREEKKVIPENKRHTKTPYDGAYVKDPVVAPYRYIVSFDLTSLYPSIIRQVNISPETIANSFAVRPMHEYINKTAPRPSDEFSCSPNGWMFRRDVKGVIPVEIKKVFDQRKAWKKRMMAGERNLELIKHELEHLTDAHNQMINPDFEFYEDFNDESKAVLKTLSKQMLKAVKKVCEKKIAQANTAQLNRKISINSLYGALGNEHFRYFDIRNASAITMFGQLAIQWIERKVNEYLNELCNTTDYAYVRYCDTDSIYVCMDNVIAKVGGESKFRDNNHWVDFLDKFSKERMEPIIDKGYRELCEYMNNVEHLMFMDREIISGPPLGSKGLGSFWTAKKRYAANVWDSEGTRYEKPKLKIMGMETQRSSTPTAVKKFLKEAIRRILQEGEESLHEHFKVFEEEYKALDYREIAGVSSANNISKYRDDFGYPIKGTPNHIKGVLFFNRYTKGFQGITPIMEGEKVMVLPLRDKNPWQSDCIAWQSGTRLPVEIESDILNWVDYNGLFEKHVISPLQNITEACKIDYEKRASLNTLFGDDW
ncbi:DNA polymerase [Klebsiella phage iPHaGe-KPN-12i]|nr:DNA polymerase [Klebsiella phage iPHaGe-KPN-12i]